MNRYMMTVGEVSSLDYDIYVLDSNDEDSTERDYDVVEVAGRSGDLHFDNGRWKNIEREYKCVCMKDAKKNIPAFVSAIMANHGYQRIEDSLNDEYYKMGECTGSVSPSFKKLKETGSFKLTFDCKPQKYLKIGEMQTVLTSESTIINPTHFEAYPVLEIVGNGNLGINGDTITITDNPGTMVIDCELGDAYSKDSHVNYNQYVSWEHKPYLVSGENHFTIPQTMTVKLTPRWWYL